MAAMFLVFVVLLGPSLSGCAFVTSHSYVYNEVDRRALVSDSDWTWGFLHLNEPLIENVVVDLTHSLERSCGTTRLVNVQTKTILRELILFQIYSVRLSGNCGSAAEGGGLTASRARLESLPAQ